MTIIANDVLRLSRALDYAAQKHSAQRRKGVAQEPYINHLSEVALLLAEATDGQDTNLIIAGLLHDCIEDQGVTHDELVAQFGDDIAGLVRECTDDKSLPKAERKRLQVANAPHKSERARMLKLADKTSNLRSVRLSPPAHWDAKRRADYFIWAQEVVTACGDVSPYLLERFEEAYRAGCG